MLKDKKFIALDDVEKCMASIIEAHHEKSFKDVKNARVTGALDFAKEMLLKLPITHLKDIELGHYNDKTKGLRLDWEREVSSSDIILRFHWAKPLSFLLFIRKPQDVWVVRLEAYGSCQQILSQNIKGHYRTPLDALRAAKKTTRSMLKEIIEERESSYAE